MNTRRPKIVTAASLFVLFCLQAMWSVYVYRILYSHLKETCNEAIETTVYKDISLRLNSGKLPEGATIIGGGLKENGKEDFTPVQEALIEYNAPVSLTQFDSIYQTFLSAENIHTKTIINKVNLRTGEILESTDPTFHAWWGIVETDPAILRRDSTEAIRAVIVSPHKNVFNRLGFLFLGSLVSIFLWGGASLIKSKLSSSKTGLPNCAKISRTRWCTI